MPLFLLSFSIIAFCIYLAWLVYLKSPNDLRNRLFFYTVLTFILWAIVNYCENEKMISDYAWLILKLDFTIASFVVGFWLAFCYTLFKSKILKRSFLYIFIISSLFSLLSFTSLIIKNISFSNNGVNFNYGPLFYFYSLYIVVYIILGSILLIFKFKHSEGRERIQTLYILTGFTLTFLIIGLINLFLQNFLPVEIYRMQIFSILFFIGFTSYAIIKHHLFDIRSIIQRGIIYSTVLSLLIGFYVILMLIIGSLFGRYANITAILSAGITALVGIAGASSLKRVFSKVTDKIFYKDKYDYTQAVYQLSEILNKNLDLEILIREMVKKLKSLLKSKEIRIILPEKNLIYDENGQIREIKEKIPEVVFNLVKKSEEPILYRLNIPDYLDEAINNKITEDYKTWKSIDYFFNKYKIELAAKIMLEEKLIGLILLGEKLSGDLYTSEDTNLLKTLSYQAAVALERARLFSEVKDYSLQLENKVEERTAEIKNLQEEQKKTMLEIAHGLQTPLTILKGELSLLSKEDAENKKIDELQKSIDRISKFIYDMLKIARLENHEPVKKSEKINLSEILTELIESLEIITKEKGIKIKYEIDPNLYIMGDKHEMEELIINLTSNSVKYIGDGTKKEINIKLAVEDAEIILSVEDTGIGIDEKHLPFLFNRFYRIEDSVQVDNRGTGLGLFICKKIVERHGGKIKVKSKVNQGSKFIVIFPFLDSVKV